jgi:6-phosphogluconolactonase/glucosamine-6-phosphate isomerase/deaminase
MGVPTSYVGYTSATTRRGDHEVHKGHMRALENKKNIMFVIQGDQKFYVHLMITVQKEKPHYLAQSDCLAADCKDQGDTRLTLTPSVIPYSNYVIVMIETV